LQRNYSRCGEASKKQSESLKTNLFVKLVDEDHNQTFLLLFVTVVVVELYSRQLAVANGSSACQTKPGSCGSSGDSNNSPITISCGGGVHDGVASICSILPANNLARSGSGLTGLPNKPIFALHPLA
jgi:hypothetical protein